MRSSDYAKLSSEDLLVLSQDDGQAFGVFYDRFETEVLAFVRRAIRRSDLAADITAEVFTVALESCSSFKPYLGSARGWLFAIARHELADCWERGRVEDRARKKLGIPPISLTDENIERIDQLALGRGTTALALLAELPPEQRSAVSGRILEERDYDVLAEELSCSSSVVRKRVSRGLLSLRRNLEERG